MVFYIILIAGSLLAQTIFENGSSDKKSTKRIALIIVFTLLLLYNGLRGLSVGPDTKTYANWFLKEKYTWDQISISEEPLFYLLTLICQKITSSYSIYFTIVAIPICLGLINLLNCESEDFFISVLLLLTFGVVYFCGACLRQAIAMGFCFLGYSYVKKRKLIPFLITILIAYGFHNSALIFLIVYPLSYLKTNVYYLAFVFIFLLLDLFGKGVLETIGNFFIKSTRFEGRYFDENDRQLNFSMLIIQLCVLLFCFCYKKEICSKYQSGNLLFNLSIISVCFETLVGTVGEFFRIAIYFSPFLVLLTTKAIASENNFKIQVMERIALTIVLLVYIFGISQNAMNYVTFWQ